MNRIQAIKFMEMASRAPQLVLACLATCKREYLDEVGTGKIKCGPAV